MHVSEFGRAYLNIQSLKPVYLFLVCVTVDA